MFTINLHGKGSIYEQIRDQILKFIQTGVLKPNDKLPSVRELSVDLGINPNTVQKAYQKLEEDGYIYILSKKGAFISEDRKWDDEELIATIRKDIVGFKSQGIPKATILNIINEVYEEVTC